MARVKVGSAESRTPEMFPGQGSPQDTNAGGGGWEKPPENPAAWPIVLHCPHCDSRMMTSQLEAIDAGTKRCMKCGAGLSRLNESQMLPVGENPQLTTKEDVAKALDGGFFGKGETVDFTKKQQEMKAAADRIAEVESAKQRKELSELEAKVKSELSKAPSTPVTFHLAFDEGERVEATHPEEVYGMKGSFSTYRVGPFTAETRIRPGETRKQALRRLLDDLEATAAEERPRARDAFLKHYEVAFTNG